MVGMYMPPIRRTSAFKNIMDAVEENLDATKCAGTSSCHSGQQCNSHKLWDDLNNVVDEFLSDISITDLVDKAQRSPYNSQGN